MSQVIRPASRLLPGDVVERGSRRYEITRSNLIGAYVDLYLVELEPPFERHVWSLNSSHKLWVDIPEPCEIPL